MEEESREMHSEDDKALLEKNKKKTVKTRAQVEALEKLYTEHKYPKESLKIQLAESIGLTEKQVSGWFCHRRLKDKRLMNGENVATGRQDRSSGVIQDRGSGHRQDSCGSTKPGDDRNFDTREVESERLTPKELSAAAVAVDPTYDHGSHYDDNNNNTSSGSSSSLRNLSNHQSGDHYDVSTPRYLVPKFPMDVKGVKARPGPSGYLKVKGGQVENGAITAVKRQLGKHYREDGPPLGVEFDQLPPGAFESSMQDPVVDETHYSGEDALLISPDVTKIRPNPKFSKGREYSSSMASYNSSIDAASFRTKKGYNIPDSRIHQKYRANSSLSSRGAYYPGNNSSLQLSERSYRDIPGSGSRDVRPRSGFEVMRTAPNSSHRHLQPYGGKTREHSDVGTKILHGENVENGYYSKSDMNEYHHSGDNGLSRQIVKDRHFQHSDRRIINENPAKIPFKNDMPAPKRIREEFPLQHHVKTPLVVDNEPPAYQVVRHAREMPSSSSEDDDSAETSSSVD